jgi:hypothetical protein
MCVCIYIYILIILCFVKNGSKLVLNFLIENWNWNQNLRNLGIGFFGSILYVLLDPWHEPKQFQFIFQKPELGVLHFIKKSQELPNTDLFFLKKKEKKRKKKGALKSIIFPPETFLGYIFLKGPDNFFFLCVMSKGSWPLDMGEKNPPNRSITHSKGLQMGASTRIRCLPLAAASGRYLLFW